MSAAPISDRPKLWMDRSFIGLNITQFLGAFNDNLFKQLVMLICLDQVSKGGKDLQGLAMALFAIPFLLVSGFAGFLSDRFSKRNIIVLCKLAEVGIVLLGMVGFMTGSLAFLLLVLCLMGFHSAFFGPSKYGILPEMLRTEDLPQANGSILMATFLAIIFGLSAAGAAKHGFADHLWLASLPCLVTAVMGLLSSLLISKTPTANPNLKFEYSALAVAPETRQLLWNNHAFLGVLLMSSVFWFVGGTIYPPTINSVCKEQFLFNDLYTGMFAASTGVGIAIGCVAAGILSKNRVRAWIVKTGAWGITISLIVLALPGPGWDFVRMQIMSAPRGGVYESTAELLVERTEDSSAAPRAEAEPQTEQNVIQRYHQSIEYYRGTALGPYASAVALVLVGLFAGFFSVPLQVYLQSNAPTEQKGRIIGANNLMNWIGIAGAGVIYSIGRWLLIDCMSLPYASLFGFAGCLMLPVAIFYRPPETKETNPEAADPVNSPSTA